MIEDFPTGPYKLIVCDPPWEYRNKKTGGSMTSGAASKYPTMSVSEICCLQVFEISAKDSVLFLWTTTPFLVDGSAYRVMDVWGFKPKTAIYWRKTMSLGMGYWFRGQVEVCILGIRGNVRAFRCQQPNFIQSKARAHSQKPEEFFQLIEPISEQFDLKPRVELFAREKRPGWDCWGNQIPIHI
jgi:site-specific DNA-methyltransferase (adenine-specific)